MGERGPALKSGLSTVAELAGVGAIVAGFALIAAWLGLIVGGFALIVVGLALDPPKRTLPSNVLETA